MDMVGIIGAFGTEGGGKRGMFMTISVLMLGIVILSMVFLLSEQLNMSKVSASEIGEIDRTAGIYSNVEDGISRIISFYINISVQNGTLTMEAPLPFPGRMSEDLERFSQFEAGHGEKNISLDIENAKNGSFIVNPGGIAVSARGNVLAIAPQDSNESSGSVGSYYVDLTFLPGEVHSANWSVVSSSSGDLIPVHVRAHDPNYAVIIDIYNDIDRNGTSVLLINDGANGTGITVVQFSDPSALRVEGGGAIGLKTIVGFNNLVSIGANDTISVWSTVNKTGPVKIS